MSKLQILYHLTWNNWLNFALFWWLETKLNNAFELQTLLYFQNGNKREQEKEEGENNPHSNSLEVDSPSTYTTQIKCPPSIQLNSILNTHYFDWVDQLNWLNFDETMNVQYKFRLCYETQTPWDQFNIYFQINYRIRLSGFQISMVPSTSPPAMRPSENCSEADPAVALPQERRLKRSELVDSPTRGSSQSSDWKSSLNISRLADELNDRSTAPAMVPAAMYGESGAKATDADLLIPFMDAIRLKFTGPSPPIKIQIPTK